MKRTNSILFIGIIVLGIAALLFKRFNAGSSPEPQNPGRKEQEKGKGTGRGTGNKQGLDRDPASINYSKHSKCRMNCRHISEAEVKDILKNGTINYKKSELQGAECSKKYAVEGYSSDKQHLRIVFAPCKEEVTVITCIDLETEWECGNCD